MTFRILRGGQPRELYPAIRQEVYRIGREALRNAFRHSEAHHVEVEVEYAPARLRIVVRDNGKGIEPGIFGAPHGSCDGLSRMQNLAEQMGAKLRLFSGVGAGTEVELSLPAEIAFVPHSRVRRLRWADA